MRIATITNWAYGFTVALTLISGATMFVASRAEDRERAAVEQRDRFNHLTSLVEQDTDRLSDQARLYSVDSNPAHLLVYQRHAANLGSIESRIARLADVGAQPAELDALREALRGADLLRNEQRLAIDAVRAGHADQARRIMFGAEYERDVDRVDAMIARFQYMLDQRTGIEVAQAAAATRQLRRASEVLVGATALLFLFVLFFIVGRRILRPVVKLSDIVTRLAAQDFTVELPNPTRVDEIGDMTQAIRIFRENGLERQRLERERDADQAMRDLMARMTQRLQGCNTAGELAEVVQLFAAELAPAFAGRLYVADDQGRTMVEAAVWHAPHESPSEFPISDCWALRRGQLHRPAGQLIDVRCAHAHASEGDEICVPLTAQGETIGLVYLEKDDVDAHEPADLEIYLELLAENVSLALANLRLRDALRAMALIDPLTGLSNRHQLDSVLSAQVRHAERNHEPVSCLMLDVDHFKRINDKFGHDGGDAVLRAVGEILAQSVREEGMAFRYGGEEFLLLMPGFDVGRARERGEQIRERISGLEVSQAGMSIGPITCSFGIATYPDHGKADTLVRVADAALYRAKEQGRDRVIVATKRERNIAA